MRTKKLFLNFKRKKRRREKLQKRAKFAFDSNSLLFLYPPPPPHLKPSLNSDPSLFLSLYNIFNKL